MSEVYLQHHGVKGMKWGVRKVRGHAGPGVYVNKRRQLPGDKRDLNTLNKGGHLSVGLTKKRQEAFDNRDKTALEKRIVKNEQKDREKASKKYDKYIDAANKDYMKKQNSMNVKAYNKAAADMNNGGIEKFNKSQEKKYGKDFANRDGYMSDYKKLFDKHFSKHMSKSVSDFYSSNKNYKKAQKLVDKYNMLEWNDHAKENVKIMNINRKQAGLE